MIDVVIEAHHPAHLHVWKHLVSHLTAAGKTVVLLSRDRDVMRPLTETMYGTRGHILTTVSKRNRLPFSEFFWRQLRVGGFLLRNRPKIVLSVMGVYTQTARLLNIPNLVLTDSEFQHTSHRIALPFATRVFVPECFSKELRPAAKVTRYPSYHELAYLHPDRFTPDERVIRSLGLEPKRYSILRLSAWNTLHDVGASGLSRSQLEETVTLLSRCGPVFVDREEVAFEGTMRPPWAPQDYHSALAHARVVVTEGSTTASEAAVLGTPAFYLNPIVSPDVLLEQQTRYGLVRVFGTALALLRALRSDILRLAPSSEYERRRQCLLRDKCDLTQFLISIVSEYV